MGRRGGRKKKIMVGTNSYSWRAESMIVVKIFFFLFSLFKIYIKNVGQEGNVHVGGGDNGPTWSFDVMLFYNIVTVTSIGYGAQFYPQTAAGRSWILLYSWVALANMALVIDAVSTFVSRRAEERRSLVRKDMAERIGWDELMGFLGNIYICFLIKIKLLYDCMVLYNIIHVHVHVHVCYHMCTHTYMYLQLD